MNVLVILAHTRSNFVGSVRGKTIYTNQKKRVTPRHLVLAIRNDEDLSIFTPWADLLDFGVCA